MKKFLLSLVLGTIFLSPALLPAEEPADLKMEFAHRLRDKNMPDLALEFLEELNKNPPPSLKQQLPLEIARMRILMTRVLQPDKQLPQLKKAREELGNYIAKAKTPAEKNALKLEQSQVTIYEGRAYLSMAVRQEEKEEILKYSQKAEKTFEQAKGEVTEIIKDLNGLLQKEEALSERWKSLFQQALQAKFELGKAYLYQSNSILFTFKTEDNIRKSKLIADSRKIFSSVYYDGKAEDKGSVDVELSSLAVAYVILTYQLDETPDLAEKTYQNLMSVQGEVFRDGQMHARYFYMQGIPQNTKIKNKLETYIKMGEAWLRDYPDHKKSDIGLGVQFLLAKAYLQKAQQISEDLANPQAKGYYNAAQKLFATVADSNSTRAPKAMRYEVGIKVLRLGEDPEIIALNTFEDCYLKAEYEMSKFREITKELLQTNPAPPKRKELLEKRKAHLQLVQAAFKRAIALADASTSPPKIAEAQYTMSYVYFLLGDPYRAAILGEFLTRERASFEKTPLAASYALNSYVTILSRFDNYANIDQVRQFAEFILNKRSEEWKGEPVVSQARYQLAMAILRDERLEGKRYQLTLKHLEQLPKDFSSYIFARCQMGQVALLAQKKEAKTKEEQEYFEKKAIEAFKSIPKLPDDVDTATAQMFFDSQRELGRLLYVKAFELMRDKKYNEANKTFGELASFADSLQKQFQKVQNIIEEKNKEPLGKALEELDKAGRYGMASIEFQNGNYDKVVSEKLTGDVVDVVREEGKKPGPIEMVDYKITGSILGLALRAHVLQGNVEQGQDILELMQRLKGGGFDQTNVMQRLLSDMQKQVNSLRAENDKKGLKETVERFTDFLDALAKKGATDVLGLQDRLFLANCYSGLDQFERAAKLLGKVEKPSELTGLENLKEEEKVLKQQEYQKKLQTYWMIRVMYGENLRKAGKIDEAFKVLVEAETDESSKVALPAKIEKIHVYEDKGLWGLAIKEWGQTLKKVQGALGGDARMAELFFKGYRSYVNCWYQYSQTDKVKGTAKEQKYINQGASYMARIEIPLKKFVKQEEEAAQKNPNLKIPPRWEPILQSFAELRNEYPKLKKAYDAYKASGQ